MRGDVNRQNQKRVPIRLGVGQRAEIRRVLADITNVLNVPADGQLEGALTFLASHLLNLRSLVFQAINHPRERNNDSDLEQLFQTIVHVYLQVTSQP